MEVQQFECLQQLQLLITDLPTEQRYNTTQYNTRQYNTIPGKTMKYLADQRLALKTSPNSILGLRLTANSCTALFSQLTPQGLTTNTTISGRVIQLCMRSNTARRCEMLSRLVGQGLSGNSE